MRPTARLGMCLLALAVGACATRGTEPSTFPGAIPPGETPVPASPPIAEAPAPADVVATALALQGVPYRWGGSDPSGFDCSGLVQYAFAQHGIILPRETADQHDVGHAIPVPDIRPGDLVFFQTVSLGPSHVGLAIGDDRFVHAPTSGGVVRVERLSVMYWSRRLFGVRRVLADGAPTAQTSTGTSPDAPGQSQTSGVTHSPAPFPGAGRR